MFLFLAVLLFRLITVLEILLLLFFFFLNIYIYIYSFTFFYVYLVLTVMHTCTYMHDLSDYYLTTCVLFLNPGSKSILWGITPRIVTLHVVPVHLFWRYCLLLFFLVRSCLYLVAICILPWWHLFVVFCIT